MAAGEARVGGAIGTTERVTTFPIERSLRIWSGFVLFAFVLTHLLNHGLGVFGLEALEAGQYLRWKIFGSMPAIVLIYSSAAVHIALALKRALGRQTWRMPPSEAAQILLGIAIPVLIVGHVVGTRVALQEFGADQSYPSILSRLWPEGAITQTLLVIVAWTHGCIGLHHYLRHRSFYRRWRTALLLAAVLVPVLALTGFVSAGREVERLPEQPTQFTEAERSALARARMIAHGSIAGVGALALLFVGAGIVRRRVGRQLVIAYRGRGPVRVPKGVSVLEASRMNGIPHPSACGGRGRCATCRVHVLSGLDKLPEPSSVEQATLARINAPADVRLACQLHPTDRLAVRILLPVLGHGTADLTPEESREWAEERQATVLVLDLRAFNTLVTAQQPYEIAVFVNRFRSEIIQAVRHHDGHVTYFYGDGLVAFFAGDHDHHDGSRAAIGAAADVARVLDDIDREMGSALSLPIRAGLGIHTGTTVLARVGEDANTAKPMALGPSVNIAQALQEATKGALADCLISETTARASGYDFSALTTRDVIVPGQEKPVKAYPIPDCATLHALVSRAARKNTKDEDEAAIGRSPEPEPAP